MPSHAVSLRCEPITARRRRARTLHLSHFFDRALPALLVSTSFLKEMFVAIPPGGQPAHGGEHRLPGSPDASSLAGRLSAVSGQWPAAVPASTWPFLRDLAHNRNEASCRSREGSGRSATCNIMLLMVDDDKVQ